MHHASSQLGTSLDDQVYAATLFLTALLFYMLYERIGLSSYILQHSGAILTGLFTAIGMSVLVYERARGARVRQKMVIVAWRTVCTSKKF